MTVVDWLIVAFVLAIALWGFREGVVIGVLFTAATVGFVWLLGAAALHGPVTAGVRRDARSPLILSHLDRVIPPSDSVLAAPPVKIAPHPDVLRAGSSVVRVLGAACGLGGEGSGWAVAPGVVVTNAHVLAGVDDASVTTQDGASLAATAIRYDSRNDLALVRGGGGTPALPIAPEATRGTPARPL